MASGDAADKGKVPQRFGTARLRTGPGPPAGRRAGRTTILCQEFLSHPTCTGPALVA